MQEQRMVLQPAIVYCAMCIRRLSAVSIDLVFWKTQGVENLWKHANLCKSVRHELIELSSDSSCHILEHDSRCSSDIFK